MNDYLFTFPYDWRKSSAVNATLLRNKIIEIRQIYPNSKVNIVTHSMGGVLARRYILDNPSPDLHHVDKLITIAAPWLGAPKAILAMETGEFLSIPLARKSTVKKLLEFFPSAHELLPSKAYFDLVDLDGNLLRPFKEDGWNANGSNGSSEVYRYNQLYNFLNGEAGDYNARLRTSQPYRANEMFHVKDGQDNWRGKGYGVSYHHLWGWEEKSETIHQVIGKIDLRCRILIPRSCRYVPVFDTKLGPGDGTVPILSASRLGNGYNYNAENTLTNKRFIGENTEHLKLTQNEDVHREIISILKGTPQIIAGAKFTPQSLTEKLNKEDNTNELNQMVEPVTQQAYYLRVGGAASAILTDEAGNLTYPLGDVPNAGVPEVTSYLLGEDTFLSIMPIDDSYMITFVTGESPVVINLTKGTHIETAQAVRYLDLDLPANTKVQLIITPEGVGELRYDSNGDGTFDTPITPTVSVTGQAAQDTDAPVVTFDQVEQSPTSRRVTITATDSGSGVRALFYSLDGTNFQPYVEPLNLNPAQTPTVYAFAEDNVANRSSLLTYSLTPPPDTTPPSITIIAPTATNYLLGQNVLANYSCSDSGSGVASCTGQTASGAAIDTSSVGTKTFRVTATDNAGNSTSQTVTYKVSYKIVALFDQTKLNNAGSTITVKLQIGSAQGANYSAANIAVMALRIMPGNLPVQSSGNSQPGNLFKFEDGMYKFNLKTESIWTSGTYQLFFSITGDPIEHSVQFRIE